MDETEYVDVNLEAAGLLFDMAYAQTSRGSTFGYERAARAVVDLDRPLTEVAQESKVGEIPSIGPASGRILMEYLDSGRSATVEKAVAASSEAKDIERRRRLRDHFLSQASVRRIMERPDGVGPADYRGDFQMHSEWTDGSEPLEVIIEACMALGYTCSAITDHSYGLAIAGGMSMETVARQQAEIDRLNRRYKGRFRLYKGIEANLRADGTIDMSRAELRRFQIVVAAAHSVLRKSDDQTRRMLTAVRQPGLNILGHPRGRKYNSRPGVSCEWDAVFEAAAKEGVAIEIDGSWDRQDVDWVLARRALERGCLFALDSDAHSNPELGYAVIALAHARLAGIPPERIVNCWPDEAILAWAEAAWSR